MLSRGMLVYAEWSLHPAVVEQSELDSIDDLSSAAGQPWPLSLRRDLLLQAGGAVFHPFPGTPAFVGLAPKRMNLSAEVLSPHVIFTIQSV